MTLELGFVSGNGQGVASLRPDTQGQYRLPAVRLYLGEPGAAPIWVERFTCRADGLPQTSGGGSAEAWAARMAAAWRNVDPSGRRLDRTLDVQGPPVAHPGFVSTDGSAVVRLVCEVEYFHIDRLTGREIRGIPYRASARTAVSFAAPQSAPQSVPQSAPAAQGAKDVPQPPAWQPHQRPGPAESEDGEYLGHAAIDYGTSNSTVTLYDALIHVKQPFSPAQVERLRAGVLAHVLGEPYPDLVVGEWESVLALAAAGMEGGGPTEPRVLADRIRSETGAQGLFRLCLLLEQRLPDCSHLLRTELALRLHRCYDAAFAEPPLEQMRLFPVELGDGTADVSSRLEVLATSPLTVRMGEPERLPGSATTLSGIAPKAPLADFRGLKLRLGNPRTIDELPGQPPLTSDALIQSALAYLIERANRYIAGQAHGRLGSGRLNDVVLTYPTVATPDVRRRLKSLVSDGLGVGRVSMHFDEAIAAVMFFVMRDFGGDLNIGVEAFRARSRPAGQGATWTQNILALDVGGGTCDMALLTLSLRDTTPLDVLTRSDADRLGRHYTLTPTVRGSSGHTRLGGDLLTLTVFHWLKSELADRLLALHPERFRSELQAAKASYVDDAGHYIPGRLAAHARAQQPELQATARRLAEAAVPTRWKNAAATEQGQRRWTFEQLWKLADQAKIHLGGSALAAGADPSPVRFGEQELSGLLESLGWETTGAGRRPGESIAFELDAAGFRELIEPHLRNVADLADGMLRGRLLTDEPLDRVVLTGKTSAMPLVRDVLVSRLGRGRKLDWDPANIEVEREYAKTATSIGAAWAEHVRQAAFTAPGAVQALNEGRTVVQIDVENLFFSLPCRFELALAHGTGDLSLFSANDVLHHLTHAHGVPPVLAVRMKETTELQDAVRIVRVREGAENITWGQFKCPEPGRPLPGGPPDAVLDARVWPGQIRVRYEITVDLEVFAYFSHGEPHFTVGSQGPSVNVWQRMHKAGLLGRGERPDRLPLSVYVNYTIAGSAHAGEGTKVFHAGSEFTETFHESDATDAPVRRAMVSGRLPDPPGSGEWEFGVVSRKKDSVQTITLGRLARPQTVPGARALFVASLDAEGALRVHVAEIPYWQASDLVQVEREPGRVLRHLMTVQDKDRDEQDDPFAGLQ